MSNPPSAAPSPQSSRPHETLGLKEAIAIIVGIVIGAGIFKAPSLVAMFAGSEGWMFAAWIVGGLISLIGALCYAELATAYPNAGGDYHFLYRAYGRGVSFLFAWARFSVITTGSIALLAFVFGDYTAQLAPLGTGHDSAVYAALAVVVLTWVNVRGMRAGARTQTWLTALEVGGLLLIIVAGLFLVSNGSTPAAASAPAAPAASSSGLPPMIGLAMVFVLLTFGGWSEVSYLSAEVKDGRRGMSRALVLGLVAVTTLYLLANLAYLNALGLQGMAQSKAVASDVFTLAFGKGSAMVFSVIVILSCLNSLNATMIFGARSNFALGQDFRTFAWLGHWHGSGNPRNSLIVQMLISLAVVMLAIVTHQGFETVVEFTAPVFWAFILLVGVALIVLRQREPDLHRPFRVPLYPWLPLAFIGVTGWMLWSSLVYTGLGAWVGAAVLVCGLIPLAWEAKRHGMRLPQGTAGRSSEA
jgi:amino acid transporter